MFIVNRYRPTFLFVFQRGGGCTPTEMLQRAVRRPAEKQKGNYRVAELDYKHGTPTGFGAVWAELGEPP